MNSVNQAWAVIKGRLTGDKKEAKKFLLSVSHKRGILQNRSESINKARKLKPYRLGTTPPRRGK